MLGKVDLDVGESQLQLLGHILDHTNIALLPVDGGISRAVVEVRLVVRSLRRLIRLRLDDINGDEAPNLDLVSENIKIEQHFVAGKRFVDRNSPSAFDF